MDEISNVFAPTIFGLVNNGAVIDRIYRKLFQHMIVLHATRFLELPVQVDDALKFLESKCESSKPDLILDIHKLFRNDAPFNNTEKYVMKSISDTYKESN